MPLEPAVGLAVLLYAALILLPGLAALRLLRVRVDDPWTRVGVAVAIGLALQPLAYLWAHLAGVPLGPTAWWIVLLVSAAYLAAGAVRSFRAGGVEGDTDARARLGHPASVTMGVVVVAVVLARWWAARDLSVPLWGDSLHHTMIARLFTSHGGLVDDWLPLAPLSTFTYHFGLHAGVASLASLTGLPEHRALLVAGQVLSAFQVLTAYALAAGLTGRRWAGVGAALAAGGLSPMPAHYVNWGRYTQLAGQVILPVAALATAWAGRPPPYDPADAQRHAWWRCWALAAVAVAGLALTHYIVTLTYGLFAAAWLIVCGGPVSRAGVRARAAALVRLLPVALGVFVLVLPWLPRLARSVIARAAVDMVTGGLPNPDVWGVVEPAAVWGQVTLLVGPLLAVAAMLAVAWGLVRRERTVVLGLVWIGFLLLAVYPQALGLPVTSPIKDFTLAIGLYVPAGLVIGAALGDAVDLATGRWARAAWLSCAGASALAVALAWGQRAPVEPQHVLVSPADERAMAWIRVHTRPEDRFLVGCMSAYGDTVCAGDDAGWWLPLLADRATTVPPVTYGVEESVDPAFPGQVNALARLWYGDLDAPETRAALRAMGVTHAYAGTVGRSLDRERLARSDFWLPVYDADGAQVYVFVPEPGAERGAPAP